MFEIDNGFDPWLVFERQFTMIYVILWTYEVDMKIYVYKSDIFIGIKFQQVTDVKQMALKC